MKDILRAALAVPALKVADVTYNKNAIIERIREAHSAGASILITPELSLTGASCGDLFFSELLLRQVESALLELAEATPAEMMAVIGAPLQIAGALYNCAVVLCDGQIAGIVPKSVLSATDLRWFACGDGLNCTAPLGDTDVCVSAVDLCFTGTDGTTVGIAVGEDLFSPHATDSALALAGAEVILHLSARPEVIGRRAAVRRTLTERSERNLAAYLSVNAGAEESTADYLYSGAAFAAMGGKLIIENKNAIDSNYLILCDMDLGRIRYDRRKVDFVTGDGDAALLLPCTLAASDGRLLQVRRLPFIPDDRAERVARCLEIYEMQAAALARRLSVTGGKLTIGISGGLDSTLAVLVAVRAMERLQLPTTNITAVTMPCFGTSDDTLQNALALMDALGVTSRTVSIKEAVLQHFKDIGHDPKDYSVTYENAQARERTQVLMDIANQVGGIVLGTGDLSEMALGWCTYNGDHMSMYSVNGDVPKTLVRWIVTSIAEEKVFPKASDVLLRVVDTPISPELLPPDAVGKIAQKTEDLVGPYALHDFFLYWAVRYQYAPSKIFALAMRAFDGIFDGATIKKWLTVFFRRFFNQQFKRNCVPDGVKIGSVGLSPRGDWQMPSDASSALWLAEIEAIEI
ncbi:MAG: NAD(+) synthase [Ruminococcaceae bacterium]|nr:NAD(+) synthase [Oscillospiraceae bacterium]